MEKMVFARSYEAQETTDFVKTVGRFPAASVGGDGISASPWDGSRSLHQRGRFKKETIAWMKAARGVSKCAA
jgi:hypothetical protein